MKAFLTIGTVVLLLAAGPGFGTNLSFLKDAPIEQFNDQDMALFKQAVEDALNHSPDGEITGWRNADTGVSGRLKPLNTYQSSDATCRRLQIANKAGGRKSNVAFNFCKLPDGTWKVAN